MNLDRVKQNYENSSSVSDYDIQCIKNLKIQAKFIKHIEVWGQSSYEKYLAQKILAFWIFLSSNNHNNNYNKMFPN